MSLTTTTANIGMTVAGSNHPDYDSGATSSPTQMIIGVANKVDSYLGTVEAHTANGAIVTTVGDVILNSSSALAITLAAPTSGLPSAGGNDGQTISIMQVSTGAHTVTTPSNVINGNKHILTFTASPGSNVVLQAYAGVWYVVGTHTLTSIT